MNLFTKWLLCYLLLTMFSSKSDSQIISISNPELKFKEITLGYQYADGVYKLKSMHLNENGFGLFHNTGLESGIYYIFLGDSILVDLLFDAEHKEKISINFNCESNVYSIEGPLPTQHYDNFLNDLKGLISIKEEQNLSKKKGKGRKEQIEPLSNFIEPQGNIQQKDSLLMAYISKSESSFLDAFLLAQTQVDIPGYTPPTGIQNVDSATWAFQISYYKKHFLDKLDLSDFRLVRTPIYTQKLNIFLDQLTSQKTESVCDAVDYIITKATEDTLTQKFVVGYMLNKYEKQKNDPISEHVYLHIIEKHYLQSGYNWITNNDIELLNKEFNKLKPASLGQLAPSIILNDTAGKRIDIHNLSSDFIVLYFMNYDCPLCEVITKHIKKTARNFDYLDFKIVGICVGNNEEKWKAYIKKQGIGDWINLIGEDNMANIALKYNLRYTPTIYLLNSDNIVIDKNMTANQLNRTFLNFALESNK